MYIKYLEMKVIGIYDQYMNPYWMVVYLQLL